MTKLILETDITGHRLEYIHHLFIGMENHSKDELVIVVPRNFESKKSLFDWPNIENVRIVYLKEDEAEIVNNKSRFKSSWQKTLLLKKYVKQLRADSVFLITLMDFIPFLPFLLPRKVRVCGIIYLIYLYRWKSSSWKTRFLDVLKYKIISGDNCIKAVFILNDAPSARRLNTIYGTDKYHYIPDPYNVLRYRPRNVRKELGIPDDSRMFLHFGGLAKRKGTLIILEALEHLCEHKKIEISIVFAGRVYEDIRDNFYSMIGGLRNRSNIKVYDQFCSNEQLADLCYSCDYILVPYLDTDQSSGVLGHAAYYGKPVLGPSKGLLGKLIRRNKLGTAIDEITPKSLAEAMCAMDDFKLNANYIEKIKVDIFLKGVYEFF